MYTFVKNEFEKEGYELLDDHYINSRHKLNYKCNRGHYHSITFRDWKSKRRCPICSIDKRASKRRLDFDVIKKSFESEGYILTDDLNYKNNDQLLEFICPNGHKHKMSYHNWKNGWRCVYCRYERQSRVYVGPNSSQWKSGIAHEPYAPIWGDKKFKESIKVRDNYECQNPHCWHKDKVLHIHHIDYNKKNCDDSNLITLCRSCNARANNRRGGWQQLYENIIQLKYNFKED